MTLVPATPKTYSREDVTVVVIEDDTLARMLICQLVTESGFTLIGTGRDGDEALDLVQSLNPAVLLTDIRMQRLDGISATRAIRAAGIEVGIIALTSFDTDATILDATAAGVDGFLSKDSDFSHVQDAIDQVYHGKPALSERATRVLLHARREPESVPHIVPHQTGSKVIVSNSTIPNSTDPNSTAVEHLTGVLGTLTVAELRVLREFARTTATNARLAEKLFMAESTVKQHLGSLQRKLNANNRAGLAAAAVRCEVEKLDERMFQN